MVRIYGIFIAIYAALYSMCILYVYYRDIYSYILSLRVIKVNAIGHIVHKFINIHYIYKNTLF